MVHCDREMFFENKDMKYCEIDVLEIFASRIALIKSKMDALVEAERQGTKQLTIPVPSNFF